MFRILHAVIGTTVASLCLVTSTFAGPVYPDSDYITGIEFNMSTLRNRAPGNGASAPESDNWAITWADDGHQYTVFGDGIGFGTFNSTRASNGVARIEGGKSNYSAFDVFKTGDVSGGWGGKSLGIISIDGELWMFRNGTGSADGAFEQTELYRSSNHGSSWSYAGVRWVASEFSGGKMFFSPTFLQFGRDYDGARDGYVYIYGPERTSSVGSDNWEVQNPGRISLLRVPKGSLASKSSYEYFAGMAGGSPQWSSSASDRQPVFQDDVNGVMRISVSYNAGLRRYILVTQQVSRFRTSDYHIGIYEAPEPWGPWRTVVFGNASTVGPSLNNDSKTVYWNFSNKWLSVDGRDFVMVYTGDGRDEWGTVEGSFIVGSGGNDVIPPSPPSNLSAQ